MTEQRGRKKWLLWLVVLPAEAGQADGNAVVKEQAATKAERRVKSSGK